VFFFAFRNSQMAARFLQKSKSHESDTPIVVEATTSHVPSGTARARIARHGVRLVHSRSPSSSPTRHGSSRDRTLGIAELDTFRTEPGSPPSSDVEGEKHDESEPLVGVEVGPAVMSTAAAPGQTSILLYFDDTDLKDTRV
jgi:hypothetical protein